MNAIAADNITKVTRPVDALPEVDPPIAAEVPAEEGLEDDAGTAKPDHVESSKKPPTSNWERASRRIQRLVPVVQSNFNDGALLRRPKEMIARLHSEDLHYENLYGSQIRLLLLEPTTCTELIKCSLHTVDLDEGPTYSALSYSWKKDRSWTSLDVDFFSAAASSIFSALRTTLQTKVRQKEFPTEAEFYKKTHDQWYRTFDWSGDSIEEGKQAILCNDKVVLIQPNLYEALNRLRQEQPGHYWVDALCIDQKNTEERSSQVQLMGKIYGSAQEVVVWLGESPAILSEGVERILQCCVKTMSTETTFSVDNILYGMEDLAVISEMDWTGNLMVEAARALIYMLTRRWFQRLWTLQEACLARKSVFRFGQHTFEPNILSTLAQFICDLADGKWSPMLKSAAHSTDMLGSLATIRSLPAVLSHRKHHEEDDSWSLMQWLRASKGRKASDARDLVFAGIALIRPSDWSCQLEQINLLTASLLLRDAPSQTWEPMPLYTLPSWMPDPSAWTSRILEPFFAHRNPMALLSHPPHLDPEPRISENGKILHLMGSQFGTIATTCRPLGLEDMAERAELVLDTLNWIAKDVPRIYAHTGCLGLEGLMRVIAAAYQTDDHSQQVDSVLFANMYTWLKKFSQRLDVFCYLITCLVAATIDVAKAKEKQMLLSAFESYTRIPADQMAGQLTAALARVKEVHHDVPWRSEEDMLNEDESLVGRDRSIEAIRKTILSNYSSLLHQLPGVNFMSLFTTGNGYIGIAPSWAREGDKVFCLAGVRSPFVFADADVAAKSREDYIRLELSTMDSGYFGSGNFRKEAFDEELTRIEARCDQPDKWTLVGEAYVEGIMQGERAQMLGWTARRYEFV